MNKYLIMLGMILIAILGFFVGYFLKVGFHLNTNANPFIIIILAGAFGGLLYTARDSGIEIPHRDPENKHIIKLGWVADCAYGIAGAFVVFLILPTEIAIVNSEQTSLLSSISSIGLVKLIAISLVGGYGGRSLVDRALENIAKKADEAKEEAKAATEKIIQKEEIDTVALELVQLQLDEGEEEQDTSKLKDSIKKASRSARFEIFKEAQMARKKANQKNSSLLMKRTIPLFEALIENESREKYHRNHAQLAYALKDKGGADDSKNDWKRAYEELSAAIQLRNDDGAKGFKMYEFNRALCAIKLGLKPKKIIDDIKIAAEVNYLYEAMKKNDDFTKWADENNFDLTSLKTK